MSDWKCFDSLLLGDYLKLLNLLSEDISVLSDVAAVVRSCSRAGDEIIAMLAGDNWRPHLVAAAAIVVGDLREAAVLEALWRRFDKGSMVSPQIAAAISICDVAFEDQARRRIESRHLGSYFRPLSPKETAALLSLCLRDPIAADWAKFVIANNADVQAMLVEDAVEYQGGERAL